jgi:hypothetical protein
MAFRLPLALLESLLQRGKRIGDPIRVSSLNCVLFSP